MKELKVHYTSELLPFSYNSQENLERSESGQLPVGQILTNHAGLAVIARGTSLEVIHTLSGTRRSACNLGLAKENVKVQCMSEFFVDHKRMLLLGLDVSAGWKRSGLLCVYDLGLSKVTRAISIPEPVTCMHPMEVDDSSQSIIAKLSNSERSQHLVAAGCQGGQTLIIRIGEIKPYDQRNDLSCPADLNMVKIKDLIKMEADEVEDETNYAVDLSEEYHSDASFRYLDAASKPIRVFKRGDVSVTSLLHIKQAALLIVGYSFGCFQIWDMHASLQMIFSSSLDSPLSDITHFGLQEPENDPRHCCYLLVGRSPSPNRKINLPTSVTLYQLVFEFKDTAAGSPPIYRELEAVCKRFEHQLTSDAYHLADSRSLGSRIIACSSLPRLLKMPKQDQSKESSFDSDVKYVDTTLSYVVWESPPQEQELHPSFHLGLFDINRWYHLQMPSSIRGAMYGSKDPVCPFFSFYSLGEVGEVILPDTLVDAHIDSKDISGFLCPRYPILEQNFWPSSLAFKCTFLAERGIVKTEMLGMQRQILADMLSKGSEAFGDTYQLFNLCWSAGLMPKLLDTSRLGDSKVQFECLMSVALEHNALSFVMACIRDWSTGEITNSGSCLRSVLQWAWKRVTKAKGLLDQYYISLFYSENSSLAVEVARDLNHCVDELIKLVQVLSALKDSPVSISDEGSASLSIKLTVATRIKRYAETILFLVQSKLLPECSDTNGPKSQMRDRICNDLLNLYSDRREPMSDSQSFVNGNVLFIDEFCKDIMEKITEHDNQNDDEFGWDGKYPPPSVNLYYWLLDVGEHLQMDKDGLSSGPLVAACLCRSDVRAKPDVNMLSDSAVCYFNIPKQKKNIIEAVWQIDRKNFEVGIAKLIEHGPDLLPTAMKIIYHFGKKSLACSVWKAKEMLSSADQDCKLSIRILLENKLLHEAYKLQGRYKETAIGFDIYHYFLEECIKNNLMTKFFDFHFTEEEENLLFEFLEKHKNPIAKDLLVVLCIKRHRYAEAIRYGGKRSLEQKVFDLKTLFGNSTSRNAVLDMTEQIIPPIQRKLISFPAQFTYKEKRQIREVARPEPLSATIVRKGDGNMTSHSNTIFKVIHSVEVNRSVIDEEDGADGEGSFNLPFVCSARRSMSAGRKRRELSLNRVRDDSDTPTATIEETQKSSMSEIVASSIPSKRRKHLHFGAEAMQLLKTPPVIKNPLHFKHMRSQRTPASILKSRLNLDKTETTGKSTRKRVVIADPNSPSTSIDHPESPSFQTRSFDLKSAPVLPKLDFSESPTPLPCDDERQTASFPDAQHTITVSADSDVRDESKSLDESDAEVRKIQDSGDTNENVGTHEDTELSVGIVPNKHYDPNLDASTLSQQINESDFDVVSGLITASSVAKDMPSLASEICAAEKITEPKISVDEQEIADATERSSIQECREHENDAHTTTEESSQPTSETTDDVVAITETVDNELVLQLSPTDDEAVDFVDQHDSEADDERKLAVSDFDHDDTRREKEVAEERDAGVDKEAVVGEVAGDVPSVKITESGFELVVDDEISFRVDTQDQKIDASDFKQHFEVEEKLEHQIKKECDVDELISEVKNEIEEEARTEATVAKTDIESGFNKEVKTEQEVKCELSFDIEAVGQNDESVSDFEKSGDGAKSVVIAEIEGEAAKKLESDEKEHQKETANDDALHGDAHAQSSAAGVESRDDDVTSGVFQQSKSGGWAASSDAFVTPNFFSLPSMRSGEVDSGSAVEELMKKGRADFKVLIDKFDATPSTSLIFGDYDTSFDSQEGVSSSSFAFTPSDLIETPTDRFAVFEALDEKQATPSKQAKTTSSTLMKPLASLAKPHKMMTRCRGSTTSRTAPGAVKSTPSPTSPSKRRSGKFSLSPPKMKRRSFHTPKVNPNEPGYERPVTRSSARKGRLADVTKPLLQNIGEGSEFIGQCISESAISFVPAVAQLDSTKKKKDARRSSLRRSLQSPSVAVSPHSMKLRSRSKIATPDRFFT
eukprot:gene14974-16517_t